MGVMTTTNEKPSVPVKRSTRSSFTVKRTNEWLLSDVPSDISVEVGGTIFALHKFPLVSRSGRIRKQLAESKDGKVHLQDMPGGADAFELAAKFCYGVNLEITALNVAILRCAASYLEMTDHYGEGSLESRTEAYLNEIVCQNLADSVTVLHSCENLLPFAEDLKIITRCIEGITSNACKEQLSTGLSRLQYSGSSHMENRLYPIGLGFVPQAPKPPPATDSWWGKELTVLNIHMFQRVLTAMKSRGLGQDIISGALMHYAQSSLEGYMKNMVRDPQCPTQPKFKPLGVSPPLTVLEREQRSVVETVVSLLPQQSEGRCTSTIPLSFLSWLLRTAIMLNATASCRMELEKRIGSHLDQASLDDLLIPSFSYNDEKHTLFDTDVVLRLVANFLQVREAEELSDGGMNARGDGNYESDGMGSPNQNAVIKVSKVMDSYLAEIAPDSNLAVSKLIALAEALPDHARLVDDGLYRAIDIFLKAHPNIKEAERNKLCKLMDCQKLSHEACSHAAQNERLPVQLAVQVLYFEQLKLRNAMNGSCGPDHLIPSSNYPQRLSSGAPSAAISPRDNYASVRRENRELKLEVARMRMRLTDLEKDHVSMKQELVKSTSTHKFLHSFSKKLGKLFRPKDGNNNNLMLNNNNNNLCGKTPADARHILSRRRRHSIS